MYMLWLTFWRKKNLQLHILLNFYYNAFFLEQSHAVIHSFMSVVQREISQRAVDSRP